MLKIIKIWKKRREQRKELIKKLIEGGFTEKDAQNIALRLEMLGELENVLIHSEVIEKLKERMEEVG